MQYHASRKLLIYFVMPVPLLTVRAASRRFVRGIGRFQRVRVRSGGELETERGYLDLASAKIALCRRHGAVPGGILEPGEIDTAAPGIAENLRS
jgi:hypothetical protein